MTIDPHVSYDIFAVIDLRETSDGGIKNPMACPVFSLLFRFTDTDIGAAVWVWGADEIRPGDTGLRVQMQSWIPEFLMDAVEGEGFVIVYANRVVPHGQIRPTTAGEIREGGGSVVNVPEPTRSGEINERHVDICLGDAPCPFGELQPNPVPKNERVS